MLEPGDDAAAIARSRDASALGIAGGDGSLAPVAAVALEPALPFVCVPNGTRDHFARDLGLDPVDPLARLVRRRERHRRRGEALARLRALWILVRERRLLRMTLDGEHLTASIVLVSNNLYELDVFSLGERARLDEGKLYVYVAPGLLPPHWDGPTAKESVTIDGPAAAATAAIDGDPVDLELPAQFSVDPGALRVLVPTSSE